jgi:hypothetical protein
VSQAPQDVAWPANQTGPFTLVCEERWTLQGMFTSKGGDITCRQKEAILSQQQHRKPFNYLNKKRDKNKGSAGPSPQQNKQFSRLRPDASIHVPPIAMYILGGLGVVFGLGANCWQWFTTFSAMMDIMTPNGTRVNNASQPLKYAVAAIIATAMQFGILLLLFKIDTRWKKNTYGMNLSQIDKMKGYGAAAVEVVQHVDVVTVYGLLSFGLDSLGDYTFIAGILQGLDFPSTLFVTFIYATSLYALSTVAFVRSVEYIGSGLAATAKYLKQVNKQSGGS